MDRRILFAWAFVPAAFVAYACGGDDEATPSEQDAGPSSSSSGETSSSGGSSSGTPADGGDPDTGLPPACPGNPLAADGDGGAADGGVVVSSDGGTVTQIVTAAANFLDGPQFTEIFDGGALVYSEVYAARTVRVAPAGGAVTEIRQMPGTPNQQLPIGNAVNGTTLLTIVANGGGTTTGQAPGILQTLPDGGAGPTLGVVGAVKDPNDLVVSKDGVIFFTDPAYQSGNPATGVYRVLPDGGSSSVKGYTNDRPDGIALSPDDKILYVAFGQAKRIERFEVGAGGATTVANPAAVQATYVDDPEGIAVDSSGNLWVAEAVRPVNGDNPANGGRVEVFAPDGKKHGEIAFPAHRPIAVAFGGTDNKTVFIVTNQNANAGNAGTAAYSGQIFKFTSSCAGLR